METYENGLLAMLDYVNEEDRSKETIARIEAYLDELDVEIPGKPFSIQKGYEILRRWDEEKPFVRKNLSASENRNLRNVLNQSCTPTRDSLIRFCFYYGISLLREANELLYAFCYNGLHLREAADLAFYFALKNGHEFEAAEQYKQKWEALIPKEKAENGPTGRYTAAVRFAADDSASWEELDLYVRENASVLGDVKVAAYKELKKLRQTIGTREGTGYIMDRAGDPERVGVDDAVFYTFFPLLDEDWLIDDSVVSGLSDRNKRIIEALRASTRSNRSGTTKKSLLVDGEKEILSARQPISRGVYILLKLYYQDFDVFYEASGEDGEAAVEAALENLNAALEECGYDTLNRERSPFDRLMVDAIEILADRALAGTEDHPLDHIYTVLSDFIMCLESI